MELTKQFIFCIIISLGFQSVKAQQIGDFRSVGNGNWTTVGIWQSYNGTSWTGATSYPGQNTGTNDVFIQGGYSVTITSSITNTINSLTVGDGSGATDNFYVDATSGLNTTLITLASGGFSEWTSNVSFYLPSGAAFIIDGGTLSDEKPCSAGKRLVIGSTIYSTCNGGAGADYDFTELQNDGGSLAVSPSSNTPICEGTILDLFSNPTGTGSSGASFSWSATGPSGYNYSSTLQNPTASGLAGGLYTFTVTITDTNGNTNTNSIDVIVNSAPTITSTTDGSRIGAGAVTLGATSSSGTLNWYTVASGGSVLGSGTSFTTPAISLTTTYYVEASDNGCISNARSPVIASILTDFDNDGIADISDLDDDNDGVLDTDEGCFTESVDFSINQNDISLSLDNGSAGIVLDITSLDNSFNMDINGIQLTSTEIEFHRPIRTVEFADGTHYGDGGVANIWSIAWNNPVNPDTPLIRLIVRANGSVEIFGSKTRNGPLEPMVFVNGLSVNPISWNTGINTVILDQVINGNTVMTGRVSSLISECSLDTDGDGLTDQVDLDSDNDGIYDLTESGALDIGGVNDVNNDGVIDGIASAFGSNGLFTAIENNDTSGASITYTISDSDGNTFYDIYELDSDGDGCNDTIEAGFSDGDDDGQLGSSAVTVDGNGLVIGQGGYSAPADINTNLIFDFQEFGVTSSIISQPSSAIVFSGTGTSFSVGADNSDTYQWQISTDGGANFTDLMNGGIYTTTSTPTLNLSTVDLSMNSYQYRVVITNTGFACSLPIVSNAAILSVRIKTIISNRRITYRVKKN